MGRTYSINGYINAALRRSSKTILVEGPSDKHALHRIAVERFPAAAGTVAIDHAGLLEDPQLAGLGNKARVLHIQACAETLSAAIPKIEEVLATLIDREWDGVSLVQYLPSPSWEPPTQKANRFVTLGHSIENYHFEADCAKEYIKYFFAEHVSAQVLEAIDARFHALLVLATVVTLKIRDDACISKSGGLFDMTHFSFIDKRYYLDPSFGAACRARQIASAPTIVADINTAVDQVWDALYGNAVVKWLPHGHIGNDIVWTGVAHIVHAAGVPIAIASDVAFSNKKERERFQAQWLSKVSPERRIPLDISVDWLHS